MRFRRKVPCEIGFQQSLQISFVHLNVSAAENTSDPMTTDVPIVIANTQNAGQQEAAALKFNVGNTNTASISAHYDQFSAGVNSSLRFYTQYQSAFDSPAERMRIRPDGSIQLGSDPPVSGSTSVTGFRFVYGQGFWWSTQGANSYWNTSSGTVWNFRINGSQKGSITSTAMAPHLTLLLTIALKRTLSILMVQSIA